MPRPTRCSPGSRRPSRRRGGQVRTLRLATDRGEADLKLEGPPLWRRAEPQNSSELARGNGLGYLAMGARMRRLLSFDCEGSALGASLDPAGGTTGLLLVTGGTQTRIGSHRMYERLAARAGRGGLALLPLRPPRSRRQRGRGSRLRGERARPRRRRRRLPPRAAAAHAPARLRPVRRRLGARSPRQGGGPRRLCPRQSLVRRGRGRRAARRRRSSRATRSSCSASMAGSVLLSGSMSYRKVLKGLGRIVASRPSSLAGEIAASLTKARVPAQLILATRDGTAIAARAEWFSPAFRSLRQGQSRAADDRQRCPHLLPPRRRRGAAGGGKGGAGSALTRLPEKGRESYAAAAASNSASARNFSASSAAMQPVPAAVTAWR